MICIFNQKIVPYIFPSISFLLVYNLAINQGLPDNQEKTPMHCLPVAKIGSSIRILAESQSLAVL